MPRTEKLTSERRNEDSPCSKPKQHVEASSSAPDARRGGERPSHELKAIYAMVERGQLPGVTRIGRRMLFRLDALLDWLGQKSHRRRRKVTSDERQSETLKKDVWLVDVMDRLRTADAPENAAGCESSRNPRPNAGRESGAAFAAPRPKSWL